MATWYTVLLAAASGATFAAVIGGVIARMLKRWIESVIAKLLAPVQKDLSDLTVRFAAETGGNSGGFRQRLNEIGEDVAELKGAFNQHVKENGK